MELHNENPFKVKSLSNAAFRISKSGIDLKSLPLNEIESIEGIGKGIAGKVIEFREKGITEELKKLLEKTPKGVVEMMDVKGIGPKKVALLWKELGIEGVGELLYACHENRLLALKGFGEKTQAEVRKNIEFKMKHAGSFHYAAVEPIVPDLLERIRKETNEKEVQVTGEFRRKLEVITHLEFLVKSKTDQHRSWEENGLKCSYRSAQPEQFALELIRTSCPADFFSALGSLQPGSSEEIIFRNAGLNWIEPECREFPSMISGSKKGAVSELISWKDLKGCLHNHSTWSDGLNTLEEMARACQKEGLEYFGICDHSRSAGYANGLSIERVAQQASEIDALNKELHPFRIFKGIESDILGDGSLDYPNEVLKNFEIVVASVHQNLKMEEKKATERILKAVENPYTTILGHPTGRLLLSRPGYPLDHKKVIDACAANGVAIELNAHPWRLDIDWRWIPYCLEKGVLISINPDAHETGGILDMQYGINVARKGGLTAQDCLNAKDLNELIHWLKTRK